MWKWTQRTFNGGVQDGTLGGRQDLQAYYNGAKTIDNFLVKRQGCISKRRGTELVANLDGLFGEGYKLTHARLIPFVYERDGGYILLFAEGVKYETRTKENEDGTVDEEIFAADTKRGVYICSAQGILRKITKRITKIGDEVCDPPQEEVSYEWVDVAFSYSESGSNEERENGVLYWFDEVGECFFLDIPYAGEDFADIGYTQSGDTLFIAHQNYPFATIKKVGDGNLFAYEVVDFKKLGATSRVYPPLLTATASENKDGNGTVSNGSPRTISYVATYVKDGVESAPSLPVDITYKLPWANGFVVSLNMDKGSNETEPDFYNVYKKESGEYGFIGMTKKLKERVEDTIAKLSCGSVGKFNITSYYRTNVPSWGNWEELNLEEVSQSLTDSGIAYVEAIKGLSTNVGCFKGEVPEEDATKPPTIRIEFNKGIRFSSFEGAFGSGAALYAKDYRWHGGLDGPASYYAHIPTGYEIETTDEVSAHFEVSIVYKKKADTQETETLLEFDVSLETDSSVHASCISVRYDGWRHQNNITQAELDAIQNRQAFNISLTESLNQVVVLEKEDAWYVKSIEITTKKGNTSVIPYLSFARFSREENTANVVEDDYVSPDVSLTPPNLVAHFESAGKYPACVAINNQRLVLASTSRQPFTLFFSTTGDLYNFNTHDAVREDDAIEATIPSIEFPEINHIVASREMLVFCDNGEWVVKPSSGNALTYKTIEIKQQSQIGCSKRLPPLAVADEHIFSESTNETLRAVRYDWTSDGYQSTDLSVLSQSLTRNNPIVDYAYKQHPDSIVICVLKDGSLATLTYMKEHEVCAWSTAHLGGGLKVRGICTDKAVHNGTTDVYLLAEKEGAYSLLRVREDAPETDVASCVCLDAMEAVEWGSRDHTYTDGHIAVNLATGEITTTCTKGNTYAIGYPYEATFRSVRPEAQGQNTIQFELKGPANAEVRVLNPSAFKVVPTDLEAEANMWTDAEVVAPEVVDGVMSWPKQSDYLLSLAGDYNTSGALTLKSESVYPLTLLSYSVNFNLDPRLNER